MAYIPRYHILNTQAFRCSELASSSLTSIDAESDSVILRCSECSLCDTVCGKLSYD